MLRLKLTFQWGPEWLSYIYQKLPSQQTATTSCNKRKEFQCFNDLEDPERVLKDEYALDSSGEGEFESIAKKG